MTDKGDRLALPVKQIVDAGDQHIGIEQPVADVAPHVPAGGVVAELVQVATQGFIVGVVPHKARDDHHRMAIPPGRLVQPGQVGQQARLLGKGPGAVAQGEQ